MSKTNTYELGFLALSHLNSDEVSALQTTFAEQVQQAGGEVVSTSDVHYISLAYDMVKKVGSTNTRHSEAYFSWMKLSLDPQELSAIDSFAGNHKDILRYMITRTELSGDFTNTFSPENQEGEEEVAEDASTAKVSEDTSDEAEEAHESLPETQEQADDLTRIEGIGPVIATTLENAGIMTFAQLADAPVEQISDYLEGVRGSHDPTTWGEQAALARDDKWDELQELQDKLDGGRE